MVVGEISAMELEMQMQRLPIGRESENPVSRLGLSKQDLAEGVELMVTVAVSDFERAQ